MQHGSFIMDNFVEIVTCMDKIAMQCAYKLSFTESTIFVLNSVT